MNYKIKTLNERLEETQKQISQFPDDSEQQDWAVLKAEMLQKRINRLNTLLKIRSERRGK